MSYAELVCVSNFSFQRGASRPDELVKRAKALGYTALAITDECSLAGIVRAHEAAKQASLKLIVGAQFTLPTEKTRIVLLAPTQVAYTQLCELITRARRAAKKGSYAISPLSFEASVKDCIGIWIPDEPFDECAGQWFAGLHLAGRYLGCVHDYSQHNDQRIERWMQYARTLSLTPIAVGDAHYHVRVRRPLHDVLTAIRLGTTVDGIGKHGFANGERHLRPLDALRKLFPDRCSQRQRILPINAPFHWTHCTMSIQQNWCPPE